MSNDVETRRVQLSDGPVNVESFSTFKMIELTVLVTEIMEEVPQLAEKLSTFSRDFQNRHSISMPRAAIELRYPPEQVAQISEEAWQAGDQKIDLPATPTAMDLIAHVIGDVMRLARERVVQIAGLISCSNSELKLADENGEVAQLVAEKAKAMRHEDAGAMLDLITAAIEVVRDQFADRGEALGPLGSMLGLGANPDPAESPIAQVTPAEETEPSSAESGSTPDTSTPSDEPSPGPEPSPSTASDSERPAASVT